jgi:PII-like signaling protein
MEFFYKNRIAGVSVFRGVAGYGSDGVFHKAKLLELSTALPVMIEVVDTEENIGRIIEGVQEIVQEGLIDVSDTQVVKCAIKEKKKGV